MYSGDYECFTARKERKFYGQGLATYYDSEISVCLDYCRDNVDCQSVSYECSKKTCYLFRNQQDDSIADFVYNPDFTYFENTGCTDRKLRFFY